MSRFLASARARRLLLGILLAGLAALVIAAPVFVLAMAPAIALFALVAHRIMPGEATLVRLLRRHVPRRRRGTAAPARYAVIVVRRVGRRLAVALAMRPPPAPLLISS